MSLEDRIRSTLNAEAERLEPVLAPVSPVRRPPVRQRGPLVALAAFVIVVAAGSMLLILRNAPPTAPAAPTTPPATTESPTTTLPSPSGGLVAVRLDDPLLYYPTLLPDGWERCQETINPPVARVSFCDPAATDHQVILDVIDARLPSSTGDEPIQGTGGWTMTTTGDGLTVHVPVAVSWRLRARSTGLDLDTLVAVLDSIPVVGDRGSLIATYELPLVLDFLDEDQLKTLFPDAVDVQSRRDRDGIFIIANSDQPDRVSVHVNPAQNTDLIDLMVNVPQPRLVAAADHPMVSGGTADLAQVFWIQRGLLWSLTTQAGSDHAETTALAVEQTIDRLQPATITHSIEAIQIDDVWVFQHDPEGADAALHGGTAEIIDGCLMVDDTIVVWPVERIDEAASIIAAIKRGEQPQVVIGGGGISISEGASPDEIPTTITDRCPTTAVWYGAP